MLLALDCSTRRFGYAFGKPEDDKPRSGVWLLPGADEMVLDRTLGMAFEQVRQFSRVIGATHAVMEAPIPVMRPGQSGNHTMAALSQMTGAVRAACHASKLQTSLVASSSARKFFCGRLDRGDNRKLAVVERCRLLGWEAVDDNAADASCCWAWGVNHFWGRDLSTGLFSQGRAA